MEAVARFVLLAASLTLKGDLSELTLKMEGRVEERTWVPDTRVQSVCPTFELLIRWVISLLVKPP